MTVIKMNKWLTVKLLAEVEPSFTEASIRNFIFSSNENGLDKHIRRVGKKILISHDGFLEWIDDKSVHDHPVILQKAIDETCYACKGGGIDTMSPGDEFTKKVKECESDGCPLHSVRSYQ